VKAGFGFKKFNEDCDFMREVLVENNISNVLRLMHLLIQVMGMIRYIMLFFVMRIMVRSLFFVFMVRMVVS